MNLNIPMVFFNTLGMILFERFITGIPVHVLNLHLKSYIDFRILFAASYGVMKGMKLENGLRQFSPLVPHTPFAVPEANFNLQPVRKTIFRQINSPKTGVRQRNSGLKTIFHYVTFSSTFAFL